MVKSEEFKKLQESIKKKTRDIFENEGIDNVLRTYIKTDIHSIIVKNDILIRVLSEMANEVKDTDTEAFNNIIKNEVVLIEYGHELLDIYNEVCEANQFEAKNNPAFRLARARFTENVFDRADKIFSTMAYDDINNVLNVFIKGKDINQILMDVGILHKKPANTDNVIQFKKPEEK